MLNLSTNKNVYIIIIDNTKFINSYKFINNNLWIMLNLLKINI